MSVVVVSAANQHECLDSTEELLDGGAAGPSDARPACPARVSPSTSGDKSMPSPDAASGVAPPPALGRVNDGYSCPEQEAEQSGVGSGQQAWLPSARAQLARDSGRLPPLQGRRESAPQQAPLIGESDQSSSARCRSSQEGSCSAPGLTELGAGADYGRHSGQSPKPRESAISDIGADYMKVNGAIRPFKQLQKPVSVPHGPPPGKLSTSSPVSI